MKRLPGLKRLNDVICKDRLERLETETLEKLRLRQDLVLTYKVIFGLVSDSCTELSIISNSDILTRGHAYKPFKRYSRVNSYKHLLAERISKPWNSQPANNDT